MTDLKLTCTKVGFTESLPIPEEMLQTCKFLSEVRDYLISQNFIPSDSEHETWRFLEPVVDEADIKRKDLRVISLQEEKRTHIEDIYADIKDLPELLLTNTAKDSDDSPDLMGFLTEGFKTGDLTVSVQLNNNNTISAQANADKFAPVMLSSVMTTPEKVHKSFPRVCICCKDSVIKFELTCCGTLGFWFEVHLNDEQFSMVRSSGVRWPEGTENVFGRAECFSWDGGDSQIVIKDSAAVGVDPDLSLSYMKVTVRAADLLSWHSHDDKDNKHIIKPQSEVGKRKLQAKLDGQLINYCHPIAPVVPPVSKLKAASKAVMSVNSLDNVAVKGPSNKAEAQTGISGEDITEGIPVRGEGQDIQYGNWWCWDLSSFDMAEETMDIYFFVFKDLATAQRYIGHFNQQALKAGASLWRS